MVRDNSNYLDIDALIAHYLQTVTSCKAITIPADTCVLNAGAEVMIASVQSSCTLDMDFGITDVDDIIDGADIDISAILSSGIGQSNTVVATQDLNLHSIYRNC